MTGTIQKFVPSLDQNIGEAFCTSGTSPTSHSSSISHPSSPPSSGASSSRLATIHLLGPGQVGQAFLQQLPATFRLVGVTDSTATQHRREGLNPRELAAAKCEGRALRDRSEAASLPLDLALDLVNADLVVDATPTGVDASASVRRHLRVLRRGKSLALATKDSLCRTPHELLEAGHRHRVGIHAVLGGTGATLTRELEELRRSCRGLAIVGNASTTAVIEAIECGHSIEVGVARAQHAGILEPDPELDLSGLDAATKLAAVAGALWRPVELGEITREHLRNLDVAAVRARARAGQTTRLVARGTAAGGLRVAFEGLQRTDPLAVPKTHVAYGYHLADGTARVHTGVGIGPERTAAALLADVLRLAKGVQS